MTAQQHCSYLVGVGGDGGKKLGDGCEEQILAGAEPCVDGHVVVPAHDHDAIDCDCDNDNDVLVVGALELLVGHELESTVGHADHARHETLE